MKPLLQDANLPQRQLQFALREVEGDVMRFCRPSYLTTKAEHWSYQLQIRTVQPDGSGFKSGSFYLLAARTGESYKLPGQWCPHL